MLDHVIARWIEEFGRAVEMFTGEKPSLSFIPAADQLSESVISGLTWWKQVARARDSFSIWAGAAEPLWTALENQETFFEMLSYANQGTVAALSASFTEPYHCDPGVQQPPALPLAVESAQVKVVFRGSHAGNILLLYDKAALEIFNSDSAPQALEPDPHPAWRTTVASPLMLSRLMDLELPVSVLLGRASITLRDALKLTSGSVVELDRQIGDKVEILVHGTVVARGEIVSVKGNYGVRVKEVISRQDRIALRGAA